MLSVAFEKAKLGSFPESCTLCRQALRTLAKRGSLSNPKDQERTAQKKNMCGGQEPLVHKNCHSLLLGRRASDDAAVVVSVRCGSEAENCGVCEGMSIARVNGEAVPTPRRILVGFRAWVVCLAFGRT